MELRRLDTRSNGWVGTNQLPRLLLRVRDENHHPEDGIERRPGEEELAFGQELSKVGEVLVHHPLFPGRRVVHERGPGRANEAEPFAHVGNTTSARRPFMFSSAS